MNPSQRDTLFFACGTFAALTGLALAAQWRSLPTLAEGPTRQLACATRSLWERGELEPPEFRAIAEEMKRQSAADGRRYWQDVFALGRAGQLYPKHNLLAPVLAVPFYALFGEAGFLLFGLASCGLLWFSLYRLARTLSGRPIALLTLALCLSSLQTWAYAYRFHYDVLAAALMLSGLDLSRRRPFLGALLFTLPIFLRTSNVLLAPFLALAWPHEPGSRGTLRAWLGMGLMLGLCLLTNHLVWGGPLTTAYHRIPDVAAGEFVLKQHDMGLDWREFLSNWDQKLLGTQTGLLTYNPVLILLPFALAGSRQHPRRRTLYWCMAAGTVNLLFIFSYQQWQASHFGNRFLFPTIYLYLLVILVWLEKFLPAAAAAAKPAARGPAIDG